MNKRKTSLAETGRREEPRQRKEQHKSHRMVNEEKRSTSPPTKAQRINDEVKLKVDREVNPKEGSTAGARSVGGSTCTETKEPNVEQVADLSEVVDKGEASMVKMTRSALMRAEKEIGESIVCAKRKRVSERVEKENDESLSWLMQRLTDIVTSKSQRMREHKCVFEDNMGAAEVNAKWLKYYKWDLEEAIRRQKGTMVHPGSEFRDVEVVEELWRRHEYWPKMRSIMKNGIDYPLEQLTEEERKGDLEFMIA